MYTQIHFTYILLTFKSLKSDSGALVSIGTRFKDPNFRNYLF